MLDFIKIHEEATAAAKEATAKFLAEHMASKPDCPYGEPEYPCGFAWVVIPCDLRSKTGKAMKAAGFERRMFGGGFEVYNPADHFGQNVDAKSAGAKANADVLNKYGITAYAQDRLD